MSLAKPAASIMRRPLRAEIKKHAAIAFGLSVACGLVWKFLVSDWRKKRYQEFYRYEYMNRHTFICQYSKFNLLQNISTYDDERHFKRMAAAGVFDSVKPDAKPPQWLVAYEKEVDAAIAALNKKK